MTVARAPKRHATARIIAEAGRVGFVPRTRVHHDALPADIVDPAVQFVVFGDPSPQGSKAHIGGGKLKESSDGLKPWRDAVRTASQLVTRAQGWRAIDEPVMVGVTFTVPSSAAATKRGDIFHTGTPDLDKLLRAVGDALQPPAQKAGKPSGLPAATEKRLRENEREVARRLCVLHDDSRIVGYLAPQKVYPGRTATSLADHPGAFIEVWRAADLLDPIGRSAIRAAPAARLMQIASPAEGWPAAFAAALSTPRSDGPVRLTAPLALTEAVRIAQAVVNDGPEAILLAAEAA